MPISWWFRAARIGSFTSAQREVIDSGESIFAREGLRSTSRGTGIRMPGIKVAGGTTTRLHFGAVVLTADRLLVSMGTFTAIDARLGDPVGAAPARVIIDADGVRATFDVAGVTGSGTGTVVWDIPVPITDDLLPQLSGHEAPVILDAYVSQTIIRRLV